jgi:putative component of membrane protein insertase Oxa1/YidC/SpoIIIJ protein YidD
MFTNFADNTCRSLAVTAITGYQKFISPHKGFACAHRVLYGTESCSQYFKRVIASEGIFTAIANAKGRFQECRDASESLKQRRQKCQRRRQYQSIRLESSRIDLGHTLHRPSLQIDTNGNDGNQENQDTSPNPENKPKSKQGVGGAQWDKNKRSPTSSTERNNNNFNQNCNDCADCANCADIGIDVLNIGDCNGDRCSNPLEEAECPELSCPELSCPDLSCPDLSCGDADCLSGLDCGSCG